MSYLFLSCKAGACSPCFCQLGQEVGEEGTFLYFSFLLLLAQIPLTKDRPCRVYSQCGPAGNGDPSFVFLIGEHPAIRKQTRFYWHQVLTPLKAHSQEMMLVNYGRSTQWTQHSDGSDDVIIFINIGESSDCQLKTDHRHRMGTVTIVKKMLYNKNKLV